MAAISKIYITLTQYFICTYIRSICTCICKIWSFYEQCCHWDSCIQMMTPMTMMDKSQLHRLIGMYAKWAKNSVYQIFVNVAPWLFTGKREHLQMSGNIRKFVFGNTCLGTNNKCGCWCYACCRFSLYYLCHVGYKNELGMYKAGVYIEGARAQTSV